MKDYWKAMGITVLATTIFIILGWLFMPVNKMVERQVLVNSHQYIEGMEQRAGILKANIAEVNAMLSAGQGDRENLQAQKRALRAQLKAISK